MSADDRCDLCDSTTGVVWAWETPNPEGITSAEAAIEANSYWFEDTIWHVCDTCHRLILNERWDSLKQRAYMACEDGLLLTVDPATGVWNKIDQRARIAHVHDLFRQHKTNFQPL